MLGLRIIATLSAVAMFSAPAEAGTRDAEAALNAELHAFQAQVIATPVRTVRSFEAALPEHQSSRKSGDSGFHLELIAGRFDSHSCLYQLRLHWPGTSTVGGDLRVSSVLRRVDCRAMADEISDSALFEVAAQRRRGHAVAVKQESVPAVVASKPTLKLAAGLAPEPEPMPVTATTIAIHTRLRERPASDAPVRAMLPPESTIVVVPTADASWYRLHGQAAFIQASSIVLTGSAQPDDDPQQLAADQPVGD